MRTFRGISTLIVILAGLFLVLIAPGLRAGSGAEIRGAGKSVREAQGQKGRAASLAEVYYLRAQGVINPVMAEFIVSNIERAEAERAAALVIELDTPGGLDTSMREIIKRELAATLPIVVYVAPAGSRAASAGVFITYAAHIAAMAPGTNIGSAHPVAMGGGKMDKTMLEKVENDAAAYIRGIARKRRRNARWAEKAVRKSVNITAEEALKIKVIDVLARNRSELLRKIDGMKVDLLGGPAVVSTEDAVVRVVEMGLRERVLKAISDPNVAYVLMMIGILGLYFELSNPGAVLPGVVGAISLVLAFYALHTLNINYAGLILIGLAVVFFIVEINVVSYGLLTLAGIVSLVLGSLMLFDSPLPFMRLSIWVMLPAVVFMAGFVAFTLYMAVRLQRRRSVAGAEGIIGARGRAVGEIRPGQRGKVFVQGEYWDAVCDREVRNGEAVEVVGVEGLLLTVRKKGTP